MAPGVGLLVPGDPSLGVIRYKGKHVVCSSYDALQMFLSNPRFFIDGVGQLAAQRSGWSLVHMLQLFSADSAAPTPTASRPTSASNVPMGTGVGLSFLEASLPALVQFDGDVGAAANMMKTRAMQTAPVPLPEEAPARYSKNGRKLVDAGVETPVHFVERHIDPHYTWNEWVLRRRALQIVQLQSCKTSSQQTDASHFRRDNDSQVYLPKDGETQTGLTVATNTERKAVYVTGLRGHVEPPVVDAATRRGFQLPSLSSQSKKVTTTAQTVSLTLNQ